MWTEKQLIFPFLYCIYVGRLRGSNSSNTQQALSHTFCVHRTAICFFSFSVSFPVLVLAKCRALKADGKRSEAGQKHSVWPARREIHYMQMLSSSVDQPKWNLEECVNLSNLCQCWLAECQWQQCHRHALPKEMVPPPPPFQANCVEQTKSQSALWAN